MSNSMLQAAVMSDAPPWTLDQIAGLAFGVSGGLTCLLLQVPLLHVSGLHPTASAITR